MHGIQNSKQQNNTTYTRVSDVYGPSKQLSQQNLLPIAIPVVELQTHTIYTDIKVHVRTTPKK
jgi:hypothetical protein